MIQYQGLRRTQRHRSEAGRRSWQSLIAWQVTWAVTLVGALSGCGDETPDVTAPFGPELAVEVGPFTIGKVVYACGEWYAAPPGDRVLIDLFFPRSAEEGAMVRPTEAETQEVEKRGGKIVKRFNVPAVRVDIPTGAVPYLIGTHSAAVANHARAVPDRTQFDLKVSVVDTTAGGKARALEAFRDAGGYTTTVFEHVPSFAGAISDDSVDTFRGSAPTAELHPERIICLSG